MYFIFVLTFVLPTYITFVASDCPTDEFYEFNSKCYIYHWTEDVDQITAETKYCDGYTTNPAYSTATLFYPITLADYQNIVGSGIFDNKVVSAWIGMIVYRVDNSAVYGTGQKVESSHLLSMTSGSYWAQGQPNSNVAQSPYQNANSATYNNDSVTVCVKLSSKSGTSGYEFSVVSCNERNKPLCFVPATTPPPKNKTGVTKSNLIWTLLAFSFALIVKY